MAQEFAGIAPPVTVCWIAINAPWVLGWQLQRANNDQAVAVSDNKVKTQPAPEKPKFATLLQEDIWGPLIYLQAELHYLKVVTVQGQQLILYNLKDAIAELSAVSGLQPHRSYWVATDQIQRFERTGRQGRLLLQDGSWIPVSQRNIEMVKVLIDIT